MKKIQIFTLILFASFSSFAQKAILGKLIYTNKAQTAVYILSNIDHKYLIEDWKSYASGFGTNIETEKNWYALSKIKSNSIFPKVGAVITKIEKNKNFNVVYCVFQDESKLNLDEKQIDTYKAKLFLENFWIYAYKKEELRMAQLDLDLANEAVQDIEKDIKKTERSLEGNLKDQEGLGKKLEASPEQLTKLIEEKEQLTKKLIEEEATQLDAKAAEDAKKEALKKEKEIAKNQKIEEKNQAKLVKKEADFEKLKTELFEQKNKLKEAKEMVKSKENAITELK